MVAPPVAAATHSRKVRLVAVAMQDTTIFITDNHALPVAVGLRQLALLAAAVGFAPWIFGLWLWWFGWLWFVGLAVRFTVGGTLAFTLARLLHPIAILADEFVVRLVTIFAHKNTHIWVMTPPISTLDIWEVALFTLLLWWVHWGRWRWAHFAHAGIISPPLMASALYGHMVSMFVRWNMSIQTGQVANTGRLAVPVRVINNWLWCIWAEIFRCQIIRFGRLGSFRFDTFAHAIVPPLTLLTHCLTMSFVTRIATYGAHLIATSTNPDTISNIDQIDIFACFRFRALHVGAITIPSVNAFMCFFVIAVLFTFADNCLVWDDFLAVTM